MRLSNREKVLLALLMVLGCVYLIDQYLLQPMIRDKQQLISENKNLSEELLGTEERIRIYQAMEKGFKYDEYQELLEAIPASPMIPNIIDYLETKARESNIKLISIQYKENGAVSPAAKPALTGEQVWPEPVNFHIVAHGSHYDLLSFIVALENAPRIYIINNLKIGSATRGISMPGIAASADNTGESAVEQGAVQAVPDSSWYDQGKSVLNLDFSAYYHNSFPDQADQP